MCFTPWLDDNAYTAHKSVEGWFLSHFISFQSYIMLDSTVISGLKSKKVNISCFFVFCVTKWRVSQCHLCFHSVWRGSWSCRWQWKRQCSSLTSAGTVYRQPGKELLLLWALWTRLSQDVCSSDSYANSLRRETLPMLSVWEAVHPERSTQRSPEGPHRREAVFLPGLREELRPLGGHEQTPAHAHRREALPLLCVRQELQPVRPLEGTWENPLWGEVWLSRVWQEFYTSFKPQEPFQASHGREAVRLRHLWKRLQPLTKPEAPQTETWADSDWGGVCIQCEQRWFITEWW